MNIKTLILDHCKRYPALKPTDIFKFLYQSTNGNGHMVKSCENAVEYIKKEASEAEYASDTLTENLDGSFCRVHLSYLKEGLSEETLGKLFYLSSLKETEDKTALDERINAVSELAYSGALPFSANEFATALEKWKSDGFPAIHHSEEFRTNYKPAYRVIHKDFVPFLPLFARVDGMLKQGKVHFAIEGGSASGKTTLTGILQELYDCNVFHMDDFFLRPEQRTAERFAEIGGNVDRERFAEEVLSSVKKGETVRYRPFDCSVQTLGEEVTVQPKKLTIIEGVYSTHPAFSRYYDYMIFLDIDPELQKQRILVRNSPQLAKRFFDEWIPLENTYFSGTDIKARADMIKKVKACKDANDDR